MSESVWAGDRLPITFVPGTSVSSSCFVDGSGHPVWPIASGGELADLTRLADLLCARIEQVDAHQCSSRQAHGGEVVAALGENSGDAAALYAHLTGRQVRMSTDISGLKKRPPPEVVITTTPQVTVELMDFLYPGEREEPAPGLIFAADAPALHRAVLLRSAGAAVCGRQDTTRLDLLPTVDIIDRFDSGSHTVIGAGAPASELRRAVLSGAAMVNVMTHSDGVDAFFGKNLTLCPMDHVREGLRHPPACQINGYCHRHDLSVAQAQVSGLLIRPEDFRARILVFHACWGLLLNGSLVHTDWGLASRFLASPALGAILTPWEYVLPEARDVRTIAQALCRGYSIGEAAALVMREPARSFGHRFCLLGDPRVRLLPPQNSDAPTNNAIAGAIEPRGLATFSQPLPVHERAGSYAEGSGIKLDDVAFLRAWLTLRRQQPGAAQSKSAGDFVLDALDGYEHATHSNDPGELEAFGARVRGALMDLVGRYPVFPLFEWLQMAKLQSEVRFDQRCFACNEPCRTFTARLERLGNYLREFRLCWHCGIVSETPLPFPGVHIRMVTASRIMLRSEDAGSKWNAVVRVKETPPLHFPAEITKWDWPHRPDGPPEEFLELPIALSRWAIASFFIVIGVRLAVFSVPQWQAWPDHAPPQNVL
jgi:hypothetical protein